MDLLGDKTLKILFDMGSFDTVQKKTKNELGHGEEMKTDIKVDLKV